MVADAGYDGALEREARDLSLLARKGRLPAPQLREVEVRRLVEAIEARRSVVLVGPVGVGKTAIVYGAAHALGTPLFEVSTTLLLANTKYLGELETKISKILEAATKQGGVLYFKDLWNLDTAGVTRHSTRSALDAIRPLVDQGKIVLVGEVTPEQWRQMMRTQAYGAMLEQLPVSPLSPEASDRIVEAEAARLSLPLDAGTRAALGKLCRRFSPALPEPGPALRLLDQLASYAEEKRRIGEPIRLDEAFVERVFSIYSGLPLFVVSRRATVRAQDIREWFKARIVGQEEAIEAVVETISLFKAGMNDPGKPLGTMLFVGPTGVGKTELARALATYLFGSPTRMLRFDLGELKDHDAIEGLIGARHDPSRPAALLDPVRAQPFQVILFDELEKAHPNVWDTLLSLLDEGRLATPTGEVVDFKSTIVVCTSNVGAEDADKSLGFAKGTGDDKRHAKVMLGLRQHFRPELLNRFAHIVVFHPLDREQVKRVARQELARVLAREGIVGRNLLVDVDEAAIEQVIERGYDARFGARALKRELQRQLVLPLALTLMEKPIEPGQLLKVSGRQGGISVRVLDTEATREAKREREPVRVRGGEKLSRADAPKRLEKLSHGIAALATEAGEERLRERSAGLEAQKLEPGFWARPAAASEVLEELAAHGVVLGRLERLRARLESLEHAAKGLDKRDKLEAFARQLEELEDELSLAWIELGRLGDAGRPDALVEIEPVGGARSAAARDRLVEEYRAWAEHQGFALEWLREPVEPDEPALLWIRGPYAAGYLASEHGLHRAEPDQLARVSVIPKVEALRAPYPMELLETRALKLSGAHGGKIRSRLVTSGGLVLSNERTLSANRELAVELWPAWCARPAASDRAVRRHDATPEPPRALHARLVEAIGLG